MLQRYRDAFQEDQFRYLYRDIQCRRASALVFLSRFAEALPILLEAVGFDFEKVSDEQDVRYALGLCLERTGDLEAAKREYHRVVSLNFKSEHEERARYGLSRMYFMAGGFAQARKQLETILQESTGVSHPVPREHVYLQLSRTCRCLGDGANERRYADLARSAKR
jgi:tetratricopeptide (TPR) repeat protein